MIDPEPLRYDLNIEPDLENFTFKGEVEILFSTAGRCSKVELDCQNLEVESCRLEVQERTEACRFDLSASDRRLVVHMPEVAGGKFALRVIYKGSIGRQMTGFYRSAYRDRSGHRAFVAVTQFQEDYARQAFPCVDRPEAKAAFRIAMVIPEGLEAVSNTEIEKTEPLAGAKKKVTFLPTPVMSTYLLFWAVGPFGTVVSEDDPRVRVRILPGQENAVGSGLKMASQALGYCEDYFGLGYPLSKLDLIAVADFAYGAMENWGAITFRENLLLDDPATTPREARLYMAEVITHEIVHQWFGNLVTPDGWKYLWLNESFATYLAYKAVDAAHPKWRCADMFLTREMASALERDGLERTIAIEIPGREQAAINASTAPIIYSKGGSMLRMVEGYIGSEAFRAALRAYLKKHAYGCAASTDLWHSFQDASGLPVADVIRRWVEQPGYPLLTVDGDRSRLKLRQARFTYLGGEKRRQAWPLPLRISFFFQGKQISERTLLMEEPELELALDDKADACLVNPGRTGFWRVFYASASMRSALAGLAGSGALDPVDRWSLEDDFFAAMRKGLLDMEQYLDLVEAVRPWTEPELPVCSTICRHLALIERICGPSNVPRAKQLGLRVALAVLGALGWQGKAQDSLPEVMLRSRMIWSAALLGDGRAAARGGELFGAWMSGARLEPDLAASVLKIGARAGALPEAEAMLARLEETASEHLRMAIAGALGWFGDQKVLCKVLDLALDRVPARIRHVVFAAAAENPAAGAQILQWFVRNLERFEKLHPILFERVLVSLVPFCGLDCPGDAFGFLDDFLKRRPDLEDATWLARQWLEVNLALKAMVRGKKA